MLDLNTRKSSEGTLTKNSSRIQQIGNTNEILKEDLSWMQYLINNKSADSKALSNSNNNYNNSIKSYNKS